MLGVLKLSNEGYNYTILKRINSLERELEKLKRDLLLNLTLQKKKKNIKSSYFGVIPSGDITEEIIEESKKSLFRALSDV